MVLSVLDFLKTQLQRLCDTHYSIAWELVYNFKIDFKTSIRYVF